MFVLYINLNPILIIITNNWLTKRNKKKNFLTRYSL